MTARSCRFCGAALRPAGSGWVDSAGWELCTNPDHQFHEPTEGEPVTTAEYQLLPGERRQSMMDDFLAVLADEPGSTIADIGRLIEDHLLPAHERLVREESVKLSGRERTVSVTEANVATARLIRDAEHGQHITITRQGHPVARLVPYGLAVDEVATFEALADEQEQAAARLRAFVRRHAEQDHTTTTPTQEDQ